MLGAAALLIGTGGGVVLLPSPPAEAASITLGTISGRVYEHVGRDSNYLSPVGTNSQNCIKYSPVDPGNSSSSTWVTAGGEALTAHGRRSRDNCYQTLRTDRQSAVGIEVLATPQIEDGVTMPLALITHYNNPVSTEASHYTGQLAVRFEAFGNVEVTFPWRMWETPNDWNCPAGVPGSGGNCDDRITFSSSVSDIELEQNGVRFKFVLQGFTDTATGVCPATPPPNMNPEPVFWTQEGQNTEACIYGYFSQIRNVVVNKEIEGTPPGSQQFSFTSQGTISGSPWTGGAADVTLSADTPLQEVFREEIHRTDVATITEAMPPSEFWQLTGLQCTETNAAGEVVPLATGTATYDLDARTVSLSEVGAPENAAHPDITCTFTNTYQAGTASLTKNLTGSTAGLTNQAKTFDITVDCGPGAIFEHTVTAGETVTLTELPPGRTCTVSETQPSGDLANSSYYWNAPFYEPAEFVVTAGGNAEVTITNSIGQNLGSLRITKSVEPATTSPATPAAGYTGGTAREFEMDYVCTLGGVTVADGTTTVTPGTPANVPGIPSGASCVVTETAPVPEPGDFADSSYTWGPGPGPVTVTVPVAASTTAAFTNTFARTYSSLTVAKLVDPAAGASPDATFTGTYDCGNGFAGTWQLAAGGEQTITGLPVGASCTVTEDAPSGGLTDTSWNWNTPTIVTSPAVVAADGSARVTITNNASQQFGTFTVTKAVEGPDGGYTGTADRAFPVAYVCTIAGGPDITGTLQIAAGATSGHIQVPAGYTCALTETLQALPGDFADASYEWVGESWDTASLPIAANANASATVTNTFTRNYTSIEITKKIDGEGYVGEGEPFAITVNCGMGEQIINVAAGGSATIPNLPVGTICTLAEQPPSEDLLAPAYDWGVPSWDGLDAAGQITALKDTVVQATVTNPTVAVFGTVTVTKDVTTGGVVAGTSFPISVTCGAQSEQFDLADGASATTQPYPVGTSCTVSEQAPTGRDGLVDDSYSWGPVPADQTVTISEANQNVSVTVENSTVRNANGQLVISKALEAPAGVVDQVTTYTGTWTCTYGGEDRGGTWSVAAGGSTVAASNILLGSTCTVSENALTTAPSSDPSFVWAGTTYAPDGGNVSLTLAAPEDTVTVTNSVDRITGSFGVTKSVQGEGYVAGSVFPFTWECAATGWAGANGQFSLANGDVWTSSEEIPALATCTVTEGANPGTQGDAYTWDGLTWSGTGATVSQDGRSVTFTVPEPDGEVPANVGLTATNTLSKKFGAVDVTKLLSGATGGYNEGLFHINLDCGVDGTFADVLGANGTVRISDIPLGATCTVTETTDRPALADASYAWGGVTIEPEQVTITAADQVVGVSVTNEITRVYGAIQVSKTLVAPDGVVDPTRTYTGSWTCQYGTDAPVTGTWEIPAGQTTAILSSEILVGSVCTATEDTLAAPSADPSYRWLEPTIVGASVEAAGESAVVAVTNEVTRDLDTVSVRKSLTDPDGGFTGGDNPVFQINYECTLPGADGSYTGSVNVAAGADPVALFAEQPGGVPAGWTCTVTETAPAGNLADGSFAWGASTVAPSEFVVGETADLVVVVSNSIERVHAPVTLVKTITDPDAVADPERIFTGTWTCQYGNNDPVTGTWETTAGAPAITLADQVLVGSACSATEDEPAAPAAMNEDPSYTWGTPLITGVTTTAEGGQVTVANTVERHVGSIIVTKEVTGETAGYTGGTDENFTINYVCSSGPHLIGDSVTLADGGSVTIPGIPFGWNCGFAESDPGTDVLADASYAWGPAEINPAQIQLSEDQPEVTVAVVNPIERVYAEVLVDKVLVDPTGVVSPDRAFSGTVTCTYGTDDPLVGTWELTATAPAVTVDFGGARPLVGSACTVTENDPGAPTAADPSYVFTAPQTTEITSLDVAGGTLTVTNTVERQLGSIAITKKVEGEVAGFRGGDEDVFTVTYTCVNPAGGTPVGGTVAVGQGFPPAVVSDLPIGWSCSITEMPPGADLLVDGSYVWAAPVITPADAVLVMNQAPEFIVTNTVERNLQMVDMAKTVTSAEQLADGTWKVSYRIVVSNPLDQESIYSLTDTLDYGAGITPTSAQWREAGGAWNTWADLSGSETLATDRSIMRNGAATYEDHVYEIEVISTVAAGVVGTVPGTCTITNDGVAGGFLNRASISVGEQTEEEVACEEPTIPGINKAFVSAVQEEDASWTVTYRLTVDNSHGNAGFYTLTDTAGFPDGLVINSWSVTDEGGDVVVGGTYGTGEIVTDAPIAAGATHTYLVTFNVDVPVTIDDELLQCSSNGTPAGHGFYNKVELTSGEDTVWDDDCAPVDEGGVPSITKTVIGATQLLDGTWQITYEVRVAANADYVTRYSLDDTLSFGAGATILEAGWSGPTSGTWDLDAGYSATLATDRALAAGAADEVYTVTVRAAVAGDAVGSPTLDCRLAEGEDGTGFLNSAVLTSGGWTGEDEACTVPVLPFMDKTALGLEKNIVDGVWDGTWTATYRLTVTNPARDGQQVSYTLTDSPAFADGVTIVRQSVTSTAAGLPDGWDGGWNAGGSVVIADRTTAAAQEVYTVAFTIRLGSDIVPEARECVPVGDTRTGLGNVGTIATGGTNASDSDCLPIPDPTISVAKSVISAERGADGVWTVVYEVRASNTGDVPVRYTLVDQPKFGQGITITGASWAQVGALRSGTWVDLQGAATLADGRELAPLSTDTYRVTVRATVGAGVVGSPAGTCLPGGSTAGGFLNTVDMSASGLSESAGACTQPTPAPPVVPPPVKPMPPTGIGGAGSVLMFAGLLSMGGLALLEMRRRRIA